MALSAVQREILARRGSYSLGYDHGYHGRTPSPHEASRPIEYHKGWEAGLDAAVDGEEYGD